MASEETRKELDLKAAPIVVWRLIEQTRPKHFVHRQLCAHGVAEMIGWERSKFN